MDAIENKYVALRQSIVDEGIVAYPVGPLRDGVRKSIDRLTAEARLPEKKKVWSTNIDAFLDETIEKGKASGNCGSFRWLKNSKDAARFYFESHHKALNQSVANRLALASVAADEGLVILAAASIGYAEALILTRRGKISDAFDTGPLANEQFFQVVKLKEGKYKWSKVKVSAGRGGSYTFFDYRHKNMEFDVQAGKLNYTGVFTFERAGEQQARASMDDRAAVVMEILEARYPELIGEYPLFNGLSPDDEFLEFYFSEKESPTQE